MRAFTRLLANVKSAKYLEPNTPTGLTGLFTHQAPRSTLLYLYHTTLEKLQTFPESSVYRQSTEALTRHRLSIIENIKPEGYDAWLERARKQLKEHPDILEPKAVGAQGDQKDVSYAVKRAGQTFLAIETRTEDVAEVEWDAEEDVGPALEGTRSEDERDQDWKSIVAQASKPRTEDSVSWEPEPPLNVDQISEIENKIGAGLIEEVIQVAEGELKLVDIMAEAKPWEQLEEKPPEGQWTTFERGAHTGSTSG